jgi:hypothetical protein
MNKKEPSKIIITEGGLKIKEEIARELEVEKIRKLN